MLEKLELIYQRWKSVEEELSSPDVMADMKRYAQLNKEYKDLAKVVDEYNIYRNIMSNIDTNKEILANEKDEEFREMAKLELDELLVKRDEKEEEIRGNFTDISSISLHGSAAFWTRWQTRRSKSTTSSFSASLTLNSSMS